MCEESLLYKARKESLLNQDEVAEKLGVSTAIVSTWERDPNKITIERLRGLYDILNPGGKVILEKFTNGIFLQ